MPDANGNFKGISVPELPWQKLEVIPDDPKDADTAEVATKMLQLAGRKTVRPVHRSSFTLAHMLDGETRFNPDGPEIFDSHGLRLDGFGEVEVDQQPPDSEA